jgi:chloramphenicol-sensitive protein RarD
VAREETGHLGLAGPAFAVAAYTIWGVMPAYWKALAEIPPPEILANRVVWSLLFTLAVLVGLGRLREVREVLRDPRRRLALLASGVLIAVNWGIFIWAVSVGRLVEASFGYYLNPLVNVALGVLLLGERLRRPQQIAIGIAALGVIVLGVGSGAAPWLPLSLAASFGLYGLVRKLTPVSSLSGLTVETALLTPLSLGYLLVLAYTGEGHLGAAGLRTNALLVFSGVVTALPLIWFASAAKRLSFSTLGLFQYLAPTLSFLLAVAVYDEPFTPVRAFAFGCIWMAIALYTADSVRASAWPVADAGT